MVKKNILAVSLLSLSSLSAMAGGLLTNINQNAAYLRNFAQEGQITLTSLYANPAGNAFLSKGWHVSINSQSAFQERNIETTFGTEALPMFQLNSNNPNATHRFEGRAKAPIIPSFSLSHNWDRWSVSAHFGLIGGGGKCEFDKGLGSFEAKYANRVVTAFPLVAANVNDKIKDMMPMVVAGVKENLQNNGVPAALIGPETITATPASKATGYNLNAYMKGRSYYFGLQLGASYKIVDNVSAYMGIRGVYATCNYNGYVQNINATYTAAAQYSYNIDPVPGMFDGLSGKDVQTLSEGENEIVDPTTGKSTDLSLNCDQTGFGIAPIFGLDWKVNDKWNLAVKYEAAARMTLKNKSEMNAVAKAEAADETSPLHEYQDGAKQRGDIPAILAVGVEYSPIKTVRVDASMKTYFEKSAVDHRKMDDLGNTIESCLGLEYDAHKFITISASWQLTHYNLKDAFMNDLSFNLSSNSIGFGVRLHPAKLFNIDLGYMHTIYQDRTVSTLGGMKVDKYNRKNKVFGIGFNFAI